MIYRTEDVKRIPGWILWYTGFLILLGFGAGALAFFSPGNIFQNVEADYGAIRAITAMFAARNVALGTIAAIALWQRDPKFLLMVFVARFIVELLDLIITVATTLVSFNMPILITSWVIIFLVPQGLGILALLKLVKEPERYRPKDLK